MIEVDRHGERFALPLNFVYGFQRFLNRMYRPNKRADVQTVFLHKIQHILLSFKALSLNITDLIEKSIQVAAGRHLWIQVAKRAGRRIARVFQRFGGCFIIFFEFGQAHDALSLHFHPACERNRERDGADGHRLRQNGFTDFTVAARRRLNQPAPVISQVDRQAVELIFYAIAVFRQAARFGRLFFAALRPCENFFLALRLIHAPKPCNMPMLFKALHHRAADATGRRIRHPLSGLFLQIAQFGIHRIPFVVGNIRFVLVVISARGFVQLVDQFAHTLQIVCLAHVFVHSSSLIIGAIASANSFTPTRTSSKRIMMRVSEPLPLTRTTAPRPNFLCITWSPGV